MSIMQLLVLILLSLDISVTSTLYPPGSRYPPKMQIFPCETWRVDSCESDLIIITAHRSMWLSLCEKHVRYNQHRKQNRWCQTACVDSLFPFKTTSCITHIQSIRSSKPTNVWNQKIKRSVAGKNTCLRSSGQRLAVLYLLQKTSDLQSLMQIENMFFKKAVNLMVNEVTLLIFLVAVWNCIWKVSSWHMSRISQGTRKPSEAKVQLSSGSSSKQWKLNGSNRRSSFVIWGVAVIFQNDWMCIRSWINV